MHNEPVPAAASTGAPRVLVVDDERDGADSLAQLLEMLGFDPLVAYDGEAGVAAALEHRPAVVILDLHMPNMGGVVACTRIRQAAGTDIKLVALTGSDQATDREAAELAGFDHFLLKPVMVGALLRVLPPAARSAA
ncbi:MAG TPA: response regulator [Ramlibacter sp.]